ncbi:MAG: sugar phosphate isomerase/epimerase [Nitrospirae bacterium]|nr:sugar phosphate isomerase/epimerase [Nitrospirota bacterium]
MALKCSFRVGNQTAFCAEPPDVPFDYAVAYGFRAFEWFPDKKEWGQGWEEKDFGPHERSIIRRKASSHDIRLSVHVPVEATPLFDASMEIFTRSVDFALDVGAVLVNVHLCLQTGVAAYLEALMPLIGLTRRAGLKLSIENTTITGPEDFNGLFSLMEQSGEDATHVGMCFDMGHANLYPDTRYDYLKYFDSLESRVPVIHVHMHENHGDCDSHLPIFTGPAGNNPAGVTGLLSRLQRRGFDGAIILEQWPNPPSLLNESRDRLASICKAVR